MKLADVVWTPAANDFWEYFDYGNVTFYRRVKSMHADQPIGELRVLPKPSYTARRTTIDELEMQALLFELEKLPTE